MKPHLSRQLLACDLQHHPQLAVIAVLRAATAAVIPAGESRSGSGTNLDGSRKLDGVQRHAAAQQAQVRPEAGGEPRSSIESRRRSEYTTVSQPPFRCAPDR